MPISEQEKQSIGPALGRIPSGIYIVTAKDSSGQPLAMMASWVQQASFEPPTLSLALAKGRPISDAIEAGKRFVVSIVPQEDPGLMRKYARGIEPGQDPFAGIQTATAPSGIAYPAEAVAYLDCELLTVCTFDADHELVIARITDGKLLAERPPYTHVRKNGFRY